MSVLDATVIAVPALAALFTNRQVFRFGKVSRRLDQDVRERALRDHR